MIDIITHPIFIWISAILAFSGLFMWLLTYIVASYCVYTQTLTRTSDDTWGRDIPLSIDDESKKMYNIGLKWAENHKQYKTDVHIVNENLNLYGEFYDLGKETCVVILSGRTDSLLYGYYFAETSLPARRRNTCRYPKGLQSHEVPNHGQLLQCCSDWGTKSPCQIL